MSETPDNPRHDGANFDAPHDSQHGMDTLSDDGAGRGIFSDAWTIASVGHGNGPEPGPLKPPGQIDVAFSKVARQDVPYEYDFNSQADVNFAPERVEVNEALSDEFGVPEPQCGCPGQPIDFNSVAPDRSDHGDLAPDGRSAPGSSGTGVLFHPSGPLD